MYGQRSNLVTAEYWRWWVVHLWVEGFFEVFATVVIAFLFTRLTCSNSHRDWRHSSRRRSFCPAASLAPSITSISPEEHRRLSRWEQSSARSSRSPDVIGYEAWENMRLARPMRRLRGSPTINGPSTSSSRCVLESGRSGSVRIPYQSAGRALLHAGTQPPPSTATPRRWCLRHAGAGSDSLLPPCPGSCSSTWKEESLKLLFWFSTSVWSSWWCLACSPSALCKPGLHPIWHMVRSLGGLPASGTMQLLRWMRVPGDILFALGALCSGGSCWGFLPGTPTTSKAPQVRMFHRAKPAEKRTSLWQAAKWGHFGYERPKSLQSTYRNTNLDLRRLL